MLIAVLLKKTITLLALIDPVSMIPFYLSAVAGFNALRAERFARILGITVVVSLLAAGFGGRYMLQFFGASMEAMEFSGGFIVFLLAIAMIQGHGVELKSTKAESESASHGALKWTMPGLSQLSALAQHAKSGFVRSTTRKRCFCKPWPAGACA